MLAAVEKVARGTREKPGVRATGSLTEVFVTELLTGRRVNKDGRSGTAAQFQFGGCFRF